MGRAEQARDTRRQRALGPPERLRPGKADHGAGCRLGDHGEAYLKASGGGTLPVKPRQIMYAARGHIQQRTGKKLDDRYFCQTILPDFVAANRS